MNKVEVLVGDITQLDVAVIVNAANSQLAGGGGVDGAIHEAAGYRQLQEACAVFGGCPTGDVRLTPSFNLPSKAIIHAVGPIWRGGEQGEPDTLRSCYRKAMAVAAKEGFESIAFSAISCGVYGYPHELAVVIAVNEVVCCLAQDSTVKKVIFCCFGEEMADLYRQRLKNATV
ncbi:MAG: macro domain-containing protein [Porticoccaceae bacterium]|nr:macro domain-containing protein [Porticoccaceae bacterium]